MSKENKELQHKRTEDNGWVIVPITKASMERHKAETKGLADILERFDKTQCFSPENPNQNQDFCMCGKPFCYECVSWRIILKYKENIAALPSDRLPPAGDQGESRSVLRRKAAQRGEPAPEFCPQHGYPLPCAKCGLPAGDLREAVIKEVYGFHCDLQKHKRIYPFPPPEFIEELLKKHVDNILSLLPHPELKVKE